MKNIFLLPVVTLWIRKLIFFYFQYFIFLVNKLRLFLLPQEKITYLFIDLNKETSYITRKLCFSQKQYYILNKWIFGLFSNKLTIFNELKRIMTNDFFFYRYYISLKLPTIIFLMYGSRLKNSIQQEIFSIETPIISFVNPSNYKKALNQKCYLTFFFFNNLRLYYYFIVFFKILKYFA